MLQTGRPQLEHVHDLVNALSCSSASQLVTIAAFTQAISCRLQLSHSSKAMRGRIARQSTACEMHQPDPFCESFGSAHASLLWSSSGFRVRCDSGLERNAMINSGRV